MRLRDSRRNPVPVGLLSVEMSAGSRGSHIFEKPVFRLASDCHARSVRWTGMAPIGNMERHRSALMNLVSPNRNRLAGFAILAAALLAIGTVFPDKERLFLIPSRRPFEDALFDSACAGTLISFDIENVKIAHASGGDANLKAD